jgi:voltage-gated potassium channel
MALIKLRKFDPFIKCLIWYSIVLYVVEVHFGSDNSRQGNPFFLWSERVVATLLTIEYLIRLQRNRGGKYIISALGLIDLIAIVPFWFGFVLPSHLRLVRTLRVLRLLKYFRYSRSLQFIVLGFYRVTGQLRSLGFAMVIIMIFSTSVIYELERKAQPDKFDNLFDAAWFTAITVTTVGYGDISPITPAGKITALVTLFPALGVFGAMVGVLSSSFSKVLDEEADPNLDPLVLFQEAKASRAKVRQLSRDYR